MAYPKFMGWCTPETKKNSPCMVVNVVHHCSPPFHQHLDKLHGRNLMQEIAQFNTYSIWKKKHFVGWYDVLSLGKISENSGARYMGVSKNMGTPKSSILMGFSIINHPFWGTPIFGNTHILFSSNLPITRASDLIPRLVHPKLPGPRVSSTN